MNLLAYSCWIKHGCFCQELEYILHKFKQFKHQNKKYCLTVKKQPAKSIILLDLLKAKSF